MAKNIWGLDKHPAPVEIPALMDTATAAEILRCNVGTLRGWIASGQLKAANLGSEAHPRWMIRREDLDAFLKLRQPEHPDESALRPKRTDGPY